MRMPSVLNESKQLLKLEDVISNRKRWFICKNKFSLKIHDVSRTKQVFHQIATHE